MNENDLKQLLTQADASTETAPLDATRLACAVRRRLHRRKQTQRYALSAAAVILIAGVFSLQKYQSYRKEQQIARLQQDIKDLSKQSEQTLALLQDMLRKQKLQDEEQRHNVQLAKYADSVRREVDEAAFILLYQADRMLEKYDDRETAIRYYNQLLERFENTPSAQTAKERLMKINQENQFNHI